MGHKHVEGDSCNDSTAESLARLTSLMNDLGAAVSKQTSAPGTDDDEMKALCHNKANVSKSIKFSLSAEKPEKAVRKGSLLQILRERRRRAIESTNNNDEENNTAAEPKVSPIHRCLCQISSIITACACASYGDTNNFDTEAFEILGLF